MAVISGLVHIWKLVGNIHVAVSHWLNCIKRAIKKPFLTRVPLLMLLMGPPKVFQGFCGVEEGRGGV